MNNRGWNDRRSWNLRIADTHSPIVPKGGEQGQDWVWFAPFGDAPSLPVPNPQVPFPSVISPAVIESWPPLGDRRLPVGARGGIPFEGTIGYLESSKKEVKTWRPGGFVIRLQKMSQPIWDLRIWNPQQVRMLLLD